MDHDVTPPPATADEQRGGAPAPATRRRRALLSVALAGGLALGGAGIAQAAAQAPTGATASSAPDGTSSDAPSAPTPPDGAPAAPGAPVGPAAPGERGTVTSVSSSSLTTTDDLGAEHTYALDSSTTVHQGPRTLTGADLGAGDRVEVRTDRSGDQQGGDGGSATATDVDVRPAHVDGVVTDVDGSTLTLTDHDGFTRTVTTDDATSYGHEGTGSADDVTAGTEVHAQGRVDQDGTTLEATSVEVRTDAGGPPAPGGPGAGPAGAAPAGPPAPSGDAAAPAPAAGGQDGAQPQGS